MNRKEIITKLMKEGLTEKTLVNMNDKQLGMLADRLLSEQYVSASTTSAYGNVGNKVFIPKNSPTARQDIDLAKKQRKTIETYEDELKEDQLLGAEKKEYSDKEKAIKAANMKIKAAIKDGKDYGDYTRLIKKLNNGKLPASTQKIIDGKKSEVNERHGGKSPTGVKYPYHGPNKPSKPKTDKGKDLKEWVDKIVQKNVRPFTSKGEIMGLINIKLTEQTKPWEDDDSDVDVMDAGQGSPQHAPIPKETEVEPDVIPARPETVPGVDPDDPFRDPHPGIDPGPKAKKSQHISAKEAKDKIIKLMKQMI